MTSVEISPVARVARDAAWAVGRDLEELRDAYAEILLALDRVRATAQGSSHPALARVQRSWSDGLSLLGQARAYLTDGIDALREMPDVHPLGTVDDVVAVATVASCSVRRVVAGLVQMRQRIATATSHATDSAEDAPHPAALAAGDRWQAGLGVLDLLIARLQHGVAALNAYTDGISGVSTLPSRRQRLAAVLPHLRYPPESVAAGAGLAGYLVRTARHRRHPAPVPPHLRLSLRRELLRALRRPPRRVVTWRARPPSGRALPGFCLRGVEYLARGDVHRYADHLQLLWDARIMDRYALALSAGLVVAAERRFPDWDHRQVRAVAHRLAQRYDPAGEQVTPALAEGLLRAALGERDDALSDGRRAALVTTGTLLLLDLLVDEAPTRALRRRLWRDEAEFRADAVELAASLDLPDPPAALAASPDPPALGAGVADPTEEEGRRGPTNR